MTFTGEDTEDLYRWVVKWCLEQKDLLCPFSPSAAFSLFLRFPSSRLCLCWRSSFAKPVAHHLYHDFDESEKDVLPSGFTTGIRQRSAVVVVSNCGTPSRGSSGSCAVHSTGCRLNAAGSSILDPRPELSLEHRACISNCLWDISSWKTVKHPQCIICKIGLRLFSPNLLFFVFRSRLRLSFFLDT